MTYRRTAALLSMIITTITQDIYASAPQSPSHARRSDLLRPFLAW